MILDLSSAGILDNTIKLYNFDLDLLIKHGCERIEWYLKHSPDVSEEAGGCVMMCCYRKTKK